MSAPGRLVLLGQPVRHSLSPVFQNAWLAEAGIALHYEAVETSAETLETRLHELAGEAGAGNITVPHKEAVAGFAHWLTPAARRIGAVNTFWTEDGTIFGDNTDVGGFVAALRHAFPRLATPQVVLVGAGGAAAAVLAGCEMLGVRSVTIVARNAERAQRLAARFTEIAPLVVAHGRLESSTIPEDVLVVNATPIGLEDGAFPLAPELLPERAHVFDLRYQRGETAWVRACRARGLQASDGLAMLVEQGRLAFERWFDATIPEERMRALAWDALGETR